MRPTAKSALSNAELWGGLVWLALSVAVAWRGWRMGLGQVNDPGSGFAIFWIGLIAAGFSLIVVVQALTHGGPSLASLWAGTRWQKIVLVTVVLLVFGAFFESIGFVACSLALLLVLMRLVDPVPWKLALPVAIGATFGVWAVLGKWLKIKLPSGILESLLG